MHTHAYIHMHAHAYTHTRTHAHTHIHTHTKTHVDKHMLTHRHSLTLIDTDTDIYTHTIGNEIIPCLHR